MSAAKKSVTLPDAMYTAALERAKRMKYASFSAYLQYLVEKDLDERPTHTIKREDPGSKKPPLGEKGGS